MSGWLDVLKIAGAALGPILTGWIGHRRATKAAASTATVLRLARDAASFIVQTTQHDDAATGLRLIEAWSKMFAEALNAAGLDLTDAQEADAITEARKVFADAGKLAVRAAAVRFNLAADQLRESLAELQPRLAQIKREQAEAKARAKVKGALEAEKKRAGTP